MSSPLKDVPYSLRKILLLLKVEPYLLMDMLSPLNGFVLPLNGFVLPWNDFAPP